MDPVEPRRENSHFFLQQNKTTQSPPPAVVPRRHSHIVNGSQSGMFEKSLEIYRLDIMNRSDKSLEIYRLDIICKLVGIK